MAVLIFVVEVWVFVKQVVSAKAQLMGKQISLTNGAASLVSLEELMTYLIAFSKSSKDLLMKEPSLERIPHISLAWA
jgi:hypothetical protein